MKALLLAAALLPVAACGSGGAGAKPRTPHVPPVAAMPAPVDFVATIDNPWMPWPVGTEWRFTGHSDQGTEKTVVTVTDRRKRILGVRARVVHDVVHVDGRLLEDTYDWYAQDSAGNVWYLGEDTTEYDESGKADTSGSWEAGKDGAKPGIAMPADPSPGPPYYQEYYRGEAEDAGQVVRTDAHAAVPFGRLTGLVETHDFTRLEPAADENKYYARGIGVVLEVSLHEKDRTELVSMTRR